MSRHSWASAPSLTTSRSPTLCKIIQILCPLYLNSNARPAGGRGGALFNSPPTPSPPNYSHSTVLPQGQVSPNRNAAPGWLRAFRSPVTWCGGLCQEVRHQLSYKPGQALTQELLINVLSTAQPSPRAASRLQSDKIPGSWRKAARTAGSGTPVLDKAVSRNVSLCFQTPTARPHLPT